MGFPGWRWYLAIRQIATLPGWRPCEQPTSHKQNSNGLKDAHSLGNNVGSWDC